MRSDGRWAGFFSVMFVKMAVISLVFDVRVCKYSPAAGQPRQPAGTTLRLRQRTM